LLCGSQDQRCLAAPAVRIRMFDRLFFPEQTFRPEVLHDDLVCFAYSHSCVFSSVFGEVSGGIYWGKYWQAILLADLKVFLTMTRCSLDRPRAVSHRHILWTQPPSVQFRSCFPSRLFE